MRAAALLILAVLGVGASARAEDLASWRADRQAAYATFKARPAGASQRWDALQSPPLVIVPAGVFDMGPQAGTGQLRGNELSRRSVRISRPLAVAKYPITVGEFADFVADTGHTTADQCWTFENGEGRIRRGRGWRNPGFVQSLSDPVLCVSVPDVAAYVAWLEAKTSRRYRLLSEAEYEYVNRAGTETAFWWGEDAGANHTDCDGCGSVWDNRRTAPVGSFPANPFGLYDTTGNTWVWTSDCYADPKTPAAAARGAEAAACEQAIRGGAWHGGPAGSRVFSRFHHTPDTHSATLGFRLARAP